MEITAEQTRELLWEDPACGKKIRGLVALVKSEAKAKQCQEHCDLPPYLAGAESLKALFSVASPEDASLGRFYISRITELFDATLALGGHDLLAHRKNYDVCIRSLLVEDGALI